MAKQLADDRQAQRRARADACEGMAQVVKPNVQARRLDHRRPRLLEVGARRGVLRPGDDMRVAFDARERGKDGERRRREVDRLLAGLAVRQEQKTALKIDLRPLRVEDFAKAGAGQD